MCSQADLMINQKRKKFLSIWWRHHFKLDGIGTEAWTEVWAGTFCGWHLESDTLDSVPDNTGKGLATYLEKALEKSSHLHSPIAYLQVKVDVLHVFSIFFVFRETLICNCNSTVKFSQFHLAFWVLAHLLGVAQDSVPFLPTAFEILLWYESQCSFFKLL